MKGDRLNIRTISSRMNVSTATVSRVLNNKPDVSPKTRQKVLSYLRQAGYRPHRSAEAIHLVGLVDTFTRHTLSSYYVSTILEAFDRKTRGFGYNTVLIPSDQILHQLASFGHSSLLKRLDGIIWMEPIYTRQIDDAVRAAGVPCVVINNCDEDVDIDVVQSDNRSSSRQAVEYLLNLGHRSIGFLGGWLHLSNHKDRFAGYRERMAEAGLAAQDDWIIDDITLWNDEGGAEGLHRLLGRRNRPTAVMLCSDYLSVGAYRAASEMGVDIPRDLSIISFDDFPLARYLDPPLTTLRQPLQEIGEFAALRLAGLMGGERLPAERQYLRCPLIVRKSVREIGEDGPGAPRAPIAPKEESMP
jgi:DNA-binding LacI/PurR family transcriptional regulator